MVSSVRSRPNHYETLGLSPSASQDEIADAFARKMGELRWHPVGSKAVICIAYETLRNAAKRREYDLSLGLISKTAPRQWGFAMTPQRWAFIAAEPAESGMVRGIEPHVAAEPVREIADEPRVSSFIASSLRDLARPMDREPSPRPPRPDPARVEREIEQILTAPVADEEESFTERRFGWAKPVLAVGGFILTAGLVGTLAGLSVTDNQAPAEPEPAATVGRPPVKQAVASTAAVASTDEFQLADQPVRVAPRHDASRHRPSAWAQKQVRDIQSGDVASGQVATTELASDALADDPLAPQPAAAKMALPDKTVARTLDRVGYKCGEVASTAAVEGSSGAFKVTCTSGQTYHAKRVQGRYRFSRSGGQ